MQFFSTAIKLASERAQALGEANITLAIRPDTPLGMLGKYAHPAEVSSTSDAVFFGEGENFQELFNESAEFIAGACAQHRDFACNVAKPAVEAAVERLKEMVSGISFDPLDGFVVDTVAESFFLSDPDFMNYVNRFYNGTSHMELRPRYPLYSGEQVLGILQSNTAINQNHLKALVSGLPDGQLDIIWQTVFMNQTAYAPTVPVQTLQDLLLDYQIGGQSALVIFLLAATLHSNIQDDVGLDLATAQRTLLEIAATAANFTRRAQELSIDLRSQGYLVRNYDYEKKRVVLDAHLQAKWIAEGGRPEVLLACLVTQRGLRTIDALRASSEELLGYWDNYVRSQQVRMDSDFHLRVCTAMRTVFRDSMQTGNLMEVEANELAKPGAQLKAEAIFNQHLDASTAAEVRQNYVDVFWRAFARGRFFYSNAYEILSDIDYEVNQRNANPDDAATVAMTNAVCRFVASMLVCRSAV